MSIKIFPAIDQVLLEVDNNLRMIETAVDQLVENNDILGNNANILRNSVASTSSAATFFANLKANENNLVVASTNDLLFT